MILAKKKEYNDESISSLKGADRVRTRPGVIFGSDGIEGCCHALFEIVANAIDEFKGGYGDKIIVTSYADLSLEVTDFGRGIPVEFNEKEGRYNWDLLFNEMYAGGKYDKENSDYAYSLGLNGLGLCATQYASEYMEVEIYNGKYRYELDFKHGKPVRPYEEELIKEEMKHKSGTRIKWRPDLKVFKEIDIPKSFFEETLRKQAICNSGLTIVFRWQDRENGRTFETQTYYYENGIIDYVKETVGDKPTLCDVQFWSGERRGKDREDLPEYNVKLNVACCFSNQVQMLEYYHNSSFLEHGGSPDKAVRNAFVYGIDAYIKQSNKYNKNETRITFQDVADCLVLVSNTYSTETSYENQTKKSITNKFIQDAMTEFLRHQLEVFFIENKPEADKIVEQVLINKRSREDAEKSRVKLKKKLTGDINMSNRVEKFVDCRSRDTEKRELYIVEGDSALGSCKQARQADFQAIMPIRGKILNCLKADNNQIAKSDIILDLVKVMGCGMDLKTKGKSVSEFDINNLRFGKVIICTDADVDGYQIRTLVLAMIYRLMPKLIDAGKVYIAVSPLYEIVSGGKSYFAYTEKEKAEILKKLDGKKVSVQRSKGLGENEPEMMSLTTMHPDTRRLQKITPSDARETAEVFDVLLGNDLQGRKEIIARYGRDYLDLADIS